MANIPKLAIFDIDGTISEHGLVAPGVVEGMKHLQSLGCRTTVSTGRGYVRLRDMFGDLFEVIVSPDTPIVVEHGTRVTDRDGQTLFGDYFLPEEVEHMLDFVRANLSLCKFVMLQPTDVTEPVEVWCADEHDVASEQAKRGQYAHIYSAPFGELRQRLLANQLTSINVWLKDHVAVTNLKLALTRTQTSLIFLDSYMEFIKNNVNKGLAVLFAANELGLKTSDLLVAGNAINDVEMLDLGAAQSILVGPKAERQTVLSYLSSPETMITVDSPAALGQYLQTLN